MNPPPSSKLSFRPNTGSIQLVHSKASSIPSANSRVSWVQYFLIAASLSSLPAAAQTWVGASPGQWTVGSNWSPVGDPNGTSTRIKIDNGAVGNADVVLSSDRTAGGLAVSFGDQLRISPNITLNLNRGGFTTIVDNDGTIAVGSGKILLQGDVDLNLFGVLTLAGGEIQATTPFAPSGGDFDVLQNRSDIKGFGTIEPALINGELVQANISGQKLSLTHVMDNASGILEASNGGILQIGSSSEILNSSGLIRANAGSTVEFNGIIIGGELDNNDGTLQSVGGSATLNGVTNNDGKVTFVTAPEVPGTSGCNALYFEGTTQNLGEISFEGNHPTEFSVIGINGFDGPVQLLGGGSLKLMQGETGSGRHVVIERFNFDNETLINGDGHIISGAVTVNVDVINSVGGTFSSPLGAPGPLVFQNTVINDGLIQSSLNLKFQGVYGFEVANRPGRSIFTTGGNFAVNNMTFENEGTLTLSGSTTGTFSGGVFNNTGTLEVIGGSTFSFTTPFGQSQQLVNNGIVKIGAASNLSLNAQYGQTPLGTTVIGIDSEEDFGTIDTTPGIGTVTRLQGKLTAELGSFDAPIGTSFPVMTGNFIGEFDDGLAAELPGDAVVKLEYVPVLDPDPNEIYKRFSQVNLSVVAAQKLQVLTSGQQTLIDALFASVKVSGASTAEIFENTIRQSLGESLDAGVQGQIDRVLSAAAALNVLGGIVTRGPVNFTNIEGGEFRVRDGITIRGPLKLEGIYQSDVVNLDQFVYGASPSQPTVVQAVTHNGLVSTVPLSYQNAVGSLLNPGGPAFDVLRAQVTAAVGFNYVDPVLAVQTARIIAIGGGNIVAISEGNLVIAPGAQNRVREVYGMLYDSRLTEIAPYLAATNPKFSNTEALSPLVTEIVAVGGRGFTPKLLELSAGVVAVGGANLNLLDLAQAATIVALGGNNIVANGGGNFTPLGSLLPAISSNFTPSSVNAPIVALGGGNIVANGGGNVIALGGANFGFNGGGGGGGGFAFSPRGTARPRVGTTNQLIVNGNFVQSEEAITRLRIYSSSNHDQIVVSEKAVLDGALGVLLVDPADLSGPAFDPSIGSSFDMIVAPDFQITEGFELRLPRLAEPKFWSHEFVDLGNGTGALRLSVGDANAAPEIEVNRLGGPAIADGGETLFGSVEPFGLISRSFVIHNTGSAPLQNVTCLIDGVDLYDFYISTDPDTTINPGESSTFVIDFFPFDVGAKTAVLHIASDDGDEDPYVITLRGTAQISVGLTYADWATNAGLNEENAHFKAIPHGDGVPNGLKFAFGMDPTAPDNRIYDPLNATPGLPNITTTRTGEQILVRTIYQRRTGSNIVCTAQMSETLAPGTFSPLLSTPTLESPSVEWEIVTHEDTYNLATTPRVLTSVKVELVE